MGTRLKWFFRLAFLLFVFAALIITVFVLQIRWQTLLDGYVDLVEGGDPNLNPVERLYLQTYLSTHSEQLRQSAGNATEPVYFIISSGQTADVIASNLSEAGLLMDTELFVRYLRYNGLDASLEAGDFTLSPQLSIPELADTLTEAFAREIKLRFLEGWRVEEMSRYLATTKPADIDADEFQAIAKRRVAFDLSRYDFLASLPPEISLEGFLFPDTYRVPLDADAKYLVEQMLTNFGRRVTPEMRQSYGTRGLSLRQAVALASIVEREAVVAEERPLIASVFYNRLNQGMKLEADPTTQYALGYQPDSESWWKSPLFREDLSVDSPYNTYVVEGLPAGPIASPSLASLQAVATPADSNFLFFVADCKADVSGVHAFSVTFDEHLAKAERCR
jgi:UPF0755 protein